MGKIIRVQKLGFQWQSEDPFLVTMYHNDIYPAGNENQGVDRALLEGRNIGEDFELRDGFRMYHGNEVPGFPAHPHRGFETVTIVLKGVVDHFDSKGSVGRYANGDVQWLTTGNGCQHTEMFPLVHRDKPNPLELFQIWLNLPAKSKTAEPEYKMLWSEDIPQIINETSGKTIVKLISGNLYDKKSLKPNSASWAIDEVNHVGIFLINMEPKSTFSLPAVSKTLNRNLYFYEGASIQIDGEIIQNNSRVKVAGDEEIIITNGDVESNILVLEGEPINEPVAQYGPFVMNTKAEIYATFAEYEQTQFGGWQWGRYDPVNEREAGRFARHSDGRIEKR